MTFLSEVFPSELDINHVHILAEVPGQQTGQGAPSSTSAYKFAVESTDQVGRARQKFCERRKSAAPSNGGQPQNFSKAQDDKTLYIPCNRPDNGPTSLPLALLDPIFGEFVDNAETYVPEPDDCEFLLRFVHVMTQFYDTEFLRREALQTTFHAHGIPIKWTTSKNCQTDGDLSFGQYTFLIAELKDEVGSAGAEPYFQAILYFLEATRNLAAKHPNSVLPCIIVLTFGPHVAFAGAAWTDRPVIQLLSPVIPCHYHDTDIKMRSMLLRHLGALRLAIGSLRSYYQKLESEDRADLTLRLGNPTHPYPTSFTSRDGSKKDFKYVARMEGHNLFFGHMVSNGGVDGPPICIKFVTQYCEEGHRLLAERNFAPKLHIVEPLHAGFYMVVMEDVSKDYTTLFDLKDRDLLSEDARSVLSGKLRQCLDQLHQAGLVHGDFRDANVMVKKTGDFNDGNPLVIDFDSCGGINQVRYPVDLNTQSVKRPKGANRGALIEVGHDLEMLESIWDWDLHSYW